MFRHLRTLHQVTRRTITSSTPRQLENKVPQSRSFIRFWTGIVDEQEDNGMPVHLKGGARDALLYRATMALTVFGCGYVVYTLINAAMPKKKE